MKLIVRSAIIGVCLLSALPCFSQPQRKTEQKPTNPALAAYQKTVFDLIGPRWYALMERYGDVVALGKLQVHVVIRADGRIAKIMILSNSSNDAAEKVVRQALAEVKIPPIPPAVIKDLPKRELEMDLAFDLSGSHS